MEGINLGKLVGDFIHPSKEEEVNSTSAAPASTETSTETPVTATASDNLAATQTTSAGELTQSTAQTEEVVNTTRHSHTTEEVERQREVERHQNIVNVVEQPVKQEDHVGGDVTQNIKPTTEIEENHAAATEENKQALSGIAQGLQDPNDGQLGSKDKTIIDKGETVNETVHTHVQNVVVPVVDRDLHEHHTVKTVIPTHQVINEAPVIQKSSATLEPISREELQSQQSANAFPIESLQDGSILPPGDSERKINGVEHGTA